LRKEGKKEKGKKGERGEARGALKSALAEPSKPS